MSPAAHSSSDSQRCKQRQWPLRRGDLRATRLAQNFHKQRATLVEMKSDSKQLPLVACALPLTFLGCAAKSDSAAVEARSLEQAVTAPCSDLLIGMPCDPDGAGAKTECEGLCWLDTNAQVVCRAVTDLGMTADSLNGRICGSPDASDCSRSCDSGSCSDRNASVASACRPAAGEHVCAGACTLIGTEVQCQPAANGCVDSGRNGCTHKLLSAGRARASDSRARVHWQLARRRHSFITHRRRYPARLRVAPNRGCLLPLSRDRARAVLEYLVTKGVERARLASEGLGETQPVADNTTESGRTKNRRVAFILIDQK